MQETYQKEVQARAGVVLKAALERGSYRSLWGAHALMALAPDPEELVDIVRRSLWKDEQGPARALSGGPFEILPCMHLLCRWGGQIPAEAEERIRDFMTQAHLERGNTENHWLMYYAGNLLAAERWPDVERTWNGLSPAAVRAEATRWISGMIARTALHGHHEYDSTGYHAEHVAAYIALADHARDPQLRQQAAKMLAVLVADMALEHFHGTWAGGHSREGYRENTWTRIGPVRALHYLYFGGQDFDPQQHVQTYVIPALTARYCPPALLAALAHDREKAHVVRKTRAPRTIYRHAEHDALPVRKYTYLSRRFALGSTQLGLPGAPAGPIDLVSWDLSWPGRDNQAKIVCNHPFRHPGRFSAFLPDFPQTIGRAIGSDKPYLQRPDRLFGASPYEQMLQHEGAIVVLYKIPHDDEAPFVNLFLPKAPSWCEREGWLFADLNGFYVGLRPLVPYLWTEIREANNDRLMVREGDLIDGWLLRLPGPHPGLVLEAVECEEAGSFEAFCRKRAALQPDLLGWPYPGRVAVRSTTGHHLEIFYDGHHRVDGERVEYDAYPLYDAPGARADLNTGRMFFSYGKEELHLDFGLDPGAPLLPMRVIG